MSVSSERFPMVRAIEDCPEDIRTTILAVQEKSGFVPNVFLMLARRPAEFRAFFAYHDALMLRESSGLTKAEREMIVVATSAVNDCLYCVVAHGAILRIYRKDPLVADHLATNWRKAALSPREQAMIAFALKVASHSQEIEDADLDRLSAQGFSREDIWDIGSIASFFALSNRLANFSGLMPNPEFHLLGRLPRPAR